MVVEPANQSKKGPSPVPRLARSRGVATRQERPAGAFRSDRLVARDFAPGGGEAQSIVGRRGPTSQALVLRESARATSISRWVVAL